MGALRSPASGAAVATREVRIGDNAQEAEQVPIQGIKAAHVLDELDGRLRTSLPPRDQWWGSKHVEFRCIY